MAETVFDRLLAEFVKTMVWNDPITEYDMDLALGNLNGFVAFLNSKADEILDPFSTGQAIATHSMDLTPEETDCDIVKPQVDRKWTRKI